MRREDRTIWYVTSTGLCPRGQPAGRISLVSGLLEAFGAAVRRRRKEIGISQGALASAAGLSRTYLVEVERGRRNPTLLTIELLAATLDVSLEALFHSAAELEPPSKRKRATGARPERRKARPRGAGSARRSRRGERA